jgi:hypothetical protein
MFSKSKRCQYCDRLIKLNLIAFLLYYYGIAAIVVIAIAFYISSLFEYCKQIETALFGSSSIACVYLIFPFIFLVGFLYYCLISKILKIQMFRK